MSASSNRQDRVLRRAAIPEFLFARDLAEVLELPLNRALDGLEKGIYGPCFEVEGRLAVHRTDLIEALRARARRPQDETVRLLVDGGGGMSASQPWSTDPRLLVNAEEASRLLCIGRRRLWTLTNLGAIPCRRIGKSVRYVPEELRAWIDLGCPSSAGAGDEVRSSLERGGAQ